MALAIRVAFQVAGESAKPVNHQGHKGTRRELFDLRARVCVLVVDGLARLPFRERFYKINC
jgi:hypothetical protein